MVLVWWCSYSHIIWITRVQANKSGQKYSNSQFFCHIFSSSRNCFMEWSETRSSSSSQVSCSRNFGWRVEEGNGLRTDVAYIFEIALLHYPDLCLCLLKVEQESSSPADNRWDCDEAFMKAWEFKNLSQGDALCPDVTSCFSLFCLLSHFGWSFFSNFQIRLVFPLNIITVSFSPWLCHFNSIFHS